MTDKIVLDNIQGTYDVTKINANFAAIQEVINESAVFKDEAPIFKSDVDMNGQRILNLPAPTSPNEPVRMRDTVMRADVQELMDRAIEAAETAVFATESIGDVVLDLQALETARLQAVESATAAIGSAAQALTSKQEAIAANLSAKAYEEASAEWSTSAATSAATATAKSEIAVTAASGASASALAAAQSAADAASVSGQVPQVQANWNETDTANKGFILNKPTIPTNTNQLTNGAGFITSAPVASVAGKTGVVTLAKGDVGLGNVDNTADVDKPVSTAVTTALNAKAALAGATFTGKIVIPTQVVGYTARGNVTGAQSFDLASTTEFGMTLTGNMSVTFTNAPSTSQSQVVYFRITNGGAYTITWPASTKFGGGSLGTLTAAGVDLLAVKWDPATSTYMVFVVKKDIK